MTTIVRPRVCTVRMSSSPKQRSSADSTKRIKEAVKKLRAAGKQKRDKISEDLKSVAETADKIARDEIEFVKALFENDETDIDDLDIEVVFEDDDESNDVM